MNIDSLIPGSLDQSLSRRRDHHNCLNQPGARFSPGIILKLRGYCKMEVTKKANDVKEKTPVSKRDSLQEFLKKQRPSCHLHFLLDSCHEVLIHFR